MDKDKQPKSQYETAFRTSYEDDLQNHQDYTRTFDAYEAMLVGMVYDSVSKTVDNSKITDSYTATLAKERADRVMAKLPEGETVAVAKADVGKGMFMDILRQKWIYPNANAQHPFATKLNLWQLYSDVYGYMPMFYDWNVSATGHAGPDCWLWNPRHLIPQRGRTSIESMEYVTALTWVSGEFLEAVIGDEDANVDNSESPTNEGGWVKDAVRELIDVAKKREAELDSELKTKTTEARNPQEKKKGICLATRYEAGLDGEWITFAPEHGYIEVRRIKNPHKNGRIPFVIKYGQALYDSFYGLGRFQRGKPIQYARDGLTNYYFRGIKMNLIPPLVVNGNGVEKHTINYNAGAIMVETQPNSVRRLETSTAGLATYQGAQSQLTGSLLSMFGSQNASLPGADALNPSQGKTPAAINLYGDKEASQDGADRRNLEVAIEQLTDGFFSLVANIGTEAIPVTLFQKDIEEIYNSGYQDVEGLFQKFEIDEASGIAGELKIKPQSFKNIEMRFNVAPDSTAAKNKADNLMEWQNMVGTISKLVNVIKDDPNVTINWGKILEAGENLSNIRGASEFITVKEGPTQQELAMQEQMEMMGQELQKAAQVIQQLQAQQQQQAPQQPAQEQVAGYSFDNPEVAEIARDIAG